MAAMGQTSPIGYLGGSTFEGIDNPNLVVEIAQWQSAEARAAHMKEAAASGLYAPLADLLAAPFRATVIRPIG
jgi:quinol monooxygenase YgiN